MSNSAPHLDYKKGHSITLKNLNKGLVEWIEAMIEGPELESAEAAERLFPSPGDEPNAKFREDWQELVVPELKHRFSGAFEKVKEDIRKMARTPYGAHLTIPVAHFEEWMSALTQLRLAIAAAYQLTEEELNRDALPAKGSEKELALHRMEFYAVLLSAILQIGELEGLWEVGDFEYSEDQDHDPAP